MCLCIVKGNHFPHRGHHRTHEWFHFSARDHQLLERPVCVCVCCAFGAVGHPLLERISPDSSKPPSLSSGVLTTHPPDEEERKLSHFPRGGRARGRATDRQTDTTLTPNGFGCADGAGHPRVPGIPPAAATVNWCAPTGWEGGGHGWMTVSPDETHMPCCCSRFPRGVGGGVWWWSGGAVLLIRRAF